MIELLLPEDAVSAEAFDDSVPAPLFPEEELALGNAVAKRRSEFATARRCAREALSALGFPAAPILTGRDREPCWPPGVVGAITHCAGYRAAAVAWSKKLLTVGLDAEPHGPLPEGVLDCIALEEESRWVARLRVEVPEVHWDRLLFSAKESVYKAWFPLARRWLDFDGAAITVDPRARTFRARLLVPGPEVDGRRITGFDGRWMVADGLVVTAIAVPVRLPREGRVVTPSLAGVTGRSAVADGLIGVAGASAAAVGAASATAIGVATVTAAASATAAAAATTTTTTAAPVPFRTKAGQRR